MEKWKRVIGHEGLYEVSSRGRIKSLDRVIPYSGNGGFLNLHGKILSLTPLNRKSQYLRVRLSDSSKISKNYLVHRIVATAFIGKSTLDVNHKNGIKTDNRVQNLEWATRSENILHSYRTGLHSQSGIKNSNSKLSIVEVIEIKKIGRKKHSHVLGKQFGVSGETIRAILNKRTWKNI